MSEQNKDTELKFDSLDDLLANPFGEEELIKPEQSPQLQEAKPVRLVDSLPEENKKRALELANQIDPTNHQAG